MANIKHLQMWDSICADARISVSKSLFGLRATAVYKPTNSVLDALVVEFSPDDGKRMKHILELPVEGLGKAIGDYRPRPIDNGNYMAEMCASRDGSFLAVRLYQFVSMSYEPVTGVICFEGSAALMVRQLF
ncbi:MAG: hypothetical protein IJR87_11615 [Bacteroidaceae bacterium]|nr:hypothetical protein [Bacteroidaceae bacterium]